MTAAMNSFGQIFRITLWGESHGPRIGVSIDGVPPGIPLSAADFEGDLSRRRSGAHGTTARREPDRPELVSGIYRGVTTGAPLTVEPTRTPTRRPIPRREAVSAPPMPTARLSSAMGAATTRAAEGHFRAASRWGSWLRA